MFLGLTRSHVCGPRVGSQGVGMVDGHVWLPQLQSNQPSFKVVSIGFHCSASSPELSSASPWHLSQAGGWPYLRVVLLLLDYD